MKMNLFVSILFFFGTVCAQAAEYRFMCLGEVPGMCDIVYDGGGKATTVKIDFADPESAALFLALQKKRIYGTKGPDDHEGVKWEQKIFLIGEFTSDLKAIEGKESTDSLFPSGLKLKGKQIDLTKHVSATMK